MSVLQPSGQPGPVTGQLPAFRVSDQDRDAVAHRLQAAFAEGRLDGDELGQRIGAALAARTSADLDALIVDLPVDAVPPPSGSSRTNSLAVAALACGIGQLWFLILAGIPAIILGHMARRQIRSTGEKGNGLALAGLILGYIGTVAVLIVVGAVIVLVLAVYQSQGVSPSP
jgi:uncharacterized protein DUF4190/uncharacterized protein DUF1707